MSSITKTDAVVLKKINYGDTSLIVSLFTKKYGKISAILKGGRNPKSKKGLILDPLNIVSVIIYNKANRDVQLISSTDLIKHHSQISEDIQKSKYAYAVIELIQYLTAAEEANPRLFNGVEKILTLLNKPEENLGIIFCRFLFFIIKELGYQLSLEKCNICNKNNFAYFNLGYNYEIGLMCNNCMKDNFISTEINEELFNFFSCLKNNKKNNFNNTEQLVNKTIEFIETYLKFHIGNFKGIKSLKIFS